VPKVIIGEGELEYAWHGPSVAEASAGGEASLVLLHEGLGCVAMWRDFPEELSRAVGCGVLAYSRRGYGSSSHAKLPRPLTYMHEEAQATLPRVLDAFGIRRAILVGHSDGASIALIHAGSADSSGRVTGLALLAPHVFCEPLSVKSIAAAREAYLHGDLRERLARYHGENVDCAFWGWNDVWLDPRFVRWNIEEFLPAVRVPVVALQSREDPYGTFAQLDAIAKGCAGHVSRVELFACGHSPHRDKPRETIDAIAALVRRAAG
jgi:pimeloyl-ACP methyl ester carboxylesterase